MPKGVKGTRKITCSKCDTLIYRNSRYCNPCQAMYQRQYRKDHPLTPEIRLKYKLAYKTRQRIKAGYIIPGPCDVCGNDETLAHHDDLQQPYKIRWLCKIHHQSANVKRGRKK